MTAKTHCVCCGCPLGTHSAISYCDWCNYDRCMNPKTGMADHGECEDEGHDWRRSRIDGDLYVSCLRCGQEDDYDA